MKATTPTRGPGRVRIGPIVILWFVIGVILGGLLSNRFFKFNSHVDPVLPGLRNDGSGVVSSESLELLTPSSKRRSSGLVGDSGGFGPTLDSVLSRCITVPAAEIPALLPQLGTLQPDGRRRLAESILLKRLTAAGPLEAMTLALGLADSRQRLQWLSGVYYDWIETDPRAAAEWLREHGKTLPDDLQQNFAGRLLQVSPEFAEKLVVDNPYYFSNSMDAALKWVKRDPAAAVKYYAKERNFAATEVLKKVFQEWGKTDAVKALEFIESDSETTRHGDWTASVIAGWGGQ